MDLPELVRADSLAQQVYNVIRRGIRDGTIPPGRFFSETEFGSSMGVSRTPVREALLALFREGLVEIVPKRGFRLVELDEDAIAEIRLLRVALEQLVVDRLTQSATADDVAELREMLAQQARSKSSMFELDEAFHLRMSELAGLHETGRMLMSVRGKMYLIASGARLPEFRNDQVIKEHRNVIDAIALGNRRTAKATIGEHVEASIAAFLAARRKTFTVRRPGGG